MPPSFKAKNTIKKDETLTEMLRNMRYKEDDGLRCDGCVHCFKAHGNRYCKLNPAVFLEVNLKGRCDFIQPKTGF